MKLNSSSLWYLPVTYSEGVVDIMNKIYRINGLCFHIQSRSGPWNNFNVKRKKISEIYHFQVEYYHKAGEYLEITSIGIWLPLGWCSFQTLGVTINPFGPVWATQPHWRHHPDFLTHRSQVTEVRLHSLQPQTGILMGI